MPWRSRSNEIRPQQRIAPAEDVAHRGDKRPNSTFVLRDASVLLGRDRRQRAEQAVGFALEAGGETQTARGEPLEFSRKSEKLVCKTVEGAMQPLPKFPTGRG